MKRIIIIAILSSLCIPAILADKTPTEVERLTYLRDKKVQDIDKKYWQEMEKLKHKSARTGSIKVALHIEKMQIKYLDRTKTAESPENASGTEKKAIAENYADIYIKGASSIRIKNEYALFEKGPRKWTTVPESVKNEKMTYCEARDAWTGNNLTIQVKSAGNIVVIIDSVMLDKRFKGWVKMDTGKYLDYARRERTVFVLKKYFEAGEYTLPLGAKFFPLIVVYM